MILTNPQNQIASDLHRFRVVNCGRRFGKTTLAIEEIKGKALSRATRIVYLAPTIQQARDIAWLQLKKELRPVIVKSKEAPSLELEVRNIKGSTSLIQLRGWEAIETLRGQQFDFVVIDEIASMRNWQENWQEVIRPTLTDTKGEALFISTPKGFNHFYDLYNKENEDKDYKSFHFSTYDNPNIPVEELEKARAELTEDRFAQEYMADFRKTEGLIYKEFNRSNHLFDLIGPTSPLEKLCGIDWGYTNPAAVLLIVRDFDNTYWVMSEWYQRGKTTEEIVEYAGSLKANKYYADPAEADRVDVLRKAKLNIREVNKDVVSGIDAVRNLFKNGKIKIHRSCQNLIWELETYAYKEKMANKNEPEEPIKENDHLVDALRYVLYMQQPTGMKKTVTQFRPDYTRSNYGTPTPRR